MKSFSHHTIAAARCIEMRGPEQFRGEASLRLFYQMRRIIVSRLTHIPALTCIYLH